MNDLIRIITEFAESKKEIERTLASATNNIIKHLFKLYCMPNNINRNHWIMEIANFLDEVKKLSGKNKFPTSKQIYDWTYFKWKDQITDLNCIPGMVETIEFDYHTVVDKSYDVISYEFDDICEKYFKWLANELGTKGIVGHKSIYDKINELI